MVGCGNSSLSEDMYSNAFKNITNIDYSEVVICKMKERTTEMKEMKWITMDARKMTLFENSSFDVILDKGTIDSFLTTQTSVWEVPEDAQKDIDLMLAEIHRVQKNEGIYVYISFGQPHFRKPLLTNWDINVETIGTMFHYFVYICKNKSK
jgi:ubiquinone/menaquinone biosynthesis C-methylase UbiE